MLLGPKKVEYPNRGRKVMGQRNGTALRRVLSVISAEGRFFTSRREGRGGGAKYGVKTGKKRASRIQDEGGDV